MGVRSVGIDLVDIERIDRAVSRHGNRFSDRLLGEREQRQFAERGRKVAYLAGRFAAKEAVVKGLGHYLKSRPSWKSIQILDDDSGQPRVSFSEDIQARIAPHNCLVSISHERSMAVAVAMFVKL